MLAEILPSPKALFGLAVATFVLRSIFLFFYNQYRIKKLGGHAHNGAVYPYFLTFGIDAAYRAIKAGKTNSTQDLWKTGFKNAGNYTLENYILGNRVLMTAEPENIKAVLAGQFQDFGKGKKFHEQWKEFLGDSIFATDGSQWHGSRQLIRPQFQKSRISDLHTFEKHIQKMLALVPRDGSTVDISDLWYRFTLDSATDFLLGENVGSLDNPRVEFAKAFADVQKFQNDVMRSGPFWKLIPRGKYNRDIAVLNNFVNPYVERTLNLSPSELKAKDEPGYNFLHALSEYTRDRVVLRDQLVAVLLAARDTTAATLSWLFHEVAKRPDVVEKMRKEILEIVGPTAEPTYEQLKDCKYITHVLNETMRLYPAVPFNVRFALKDTTLPRGGGPMGLDPVAVLKDTPVGYSTLVMQRRTDIFGPDAEEFRPERWENGWSPKSWTYVPFNGGPRICLGQQFAITEMQYVIVRTLQLFKAVEPRETIPQEIRSEVVITPAHPVLVSLKPVEKA